MDFSLIKEHPWETTGIVLFGAVVLYVLFHRDSGGSTTVVSGGTTASNPAADQLAAQQQQLSTQLQGLTIQGQTQIALAQIGAGSTALQVGASRDIQNTSTTASLQLGLAQVGAQLQYGIGAQQSTIEQARINAAIQMRAIDAIVGAYGGNTTPPNMVNYNPTPTAPAPSPANPYTASGSVYGVTTIIPSTGGSTDLVPRPAYPNCDPRDITCVNNNQGNEVSWVNQLLGSQASNNRAQCLANAELSKDYPNYSALVAACG